MVMCIGPLHQAGSDSLLTASTFFKMRKLYFRDVADANGLLDPGRDGATPTERVNPSRQWRPALPWHAPLTEVGYADR